MKRKPRIYCFGCSFTEGIKETNFTSWVHFLAKILPEYDFFNYGVGGTSELFHAYLLRTLPDKQETDICIFQITSRSRLTWWNEIDYHSLIQNENLNIYSLNKKIIYENVYRINIGTLSNFLDRNYKFAKQYYKLTTPVYHNESFKANIKYASDYFDYAFYHRKRIENKYDSFQDSITNDEWKCYTIDEGDHFNDLGCQQEAEWIYNNLKKRNIIK